MFRNLLVALDGSDHAQRALDEAVDLARSSGGSLTLATVVPELSGWVYRGGGLAPPVNFASLQDELEREYRGLLDQAMAKVPDDLPSSSVLLEGRPAEALVRQVRSEGYDLVVMGSRGRGELRSMLL